MELVPSRLRGETAAFDIKSEDGEVLVESGRRVTARHIIIIFFKFFIHLLLPLSFIIFLFLSLYYFYFSSFFFISYSFFLLSLYLISYFFLSFLTIFFTFFFI